MPEKSLCRKIETIARTEIKTILQTEIETIVRTEIETILQTEIARTEIRRTPDGDRDNC